MRYRKLRMTSRHSFPLPLCSDSLSDLSFAGVRRSNKQQRPDGMLSLKGIQRCRTENTAVVKAFQMMAYKRSAND
jgi:hypothetical protein